MFVLQSVHSYVRMMERLILLRVNVRVIKTGQDLVAQVSFNNHFI